MKSMEIISCEVASVGWAAGIRQVHREGVTRGGGAYLGGMLTCYFQVGKVSQ